MKLKLDLLEQHIQHFIEGSANHFLWGDERVMVARKLVKALESEITPIDDGQFYIPTTFAIQLHPQKHMIWQSDTDLIPALTIAIQEAAVESDLPITAKPVIYLEVNTELSEDELIVQIIHPTNRSSQTALMTSEKNDNADDQGTFTRQAFIILESGEHFPLDKAVINIGRRSGNSLVINDLHISREHAQIRGVKGNFILFDLNSTGGTFVNGRKVTQHVLQPGDVISLSGHPLIYVEDNIDSESRENGVGITQTTRMESSPHEKEEH